MSIMDSITLSLALLGTILGIMNTWRETNRDKVKLKIIPKIAKPFGYNNFGQIAILHSTIETDFNSGVMVSFEIVNLGLLPVTVNEIGFRLKKTSSRGVILMPHGGRLPIRLEPKSSVALHTKPLTELDIQNKIKCFYVETACGETFTGKNKIIAVINKHIPLNEVNLDPALSFKSS